jgi:Ca-activated chloride channel family protein
MSDLTDFHFLRPWCLLALPVVVLVWWRLRQVGDPLRGWRRAMDPELLEAMTLGRGDSSGHRGVLFLAASLLAVLVVAGPVWRLEPSPFAGDPAPVMVLLCADESMDRDDLTPSRMQRAQLKVHDLATGREGGSLGLLAYAGSAHLVLPPTRDAAVVASMASHISPEIMPDPGDDLAAAVVVGKRSLRETGGALVIVADDAVALTAMDLAEAWEGPRVDIHFLAVAREGTPELDAIRQVARQLKADVTLMTADDADVRQILKAVEGVRGSAAAEEGGGRWAEDGWYLTPLVALLMLPMFRREEQSSPTEEAV